MKSVISEFGLTFLKNEVVSEQFSCSPCSEISNFISVLRADPRDRHRRSSGMDTEGLASREEVLSICPFKSGEAARPTPGSQLPVCT